MPITAALLAAGDSTTTGAIIEAFKADAGFIAFSKSEMEDIMARDKEDGDKLAAGVQLGVDKGVLQVSHTCGWGC